MSKNLNRPFFMDFLTALSVKHSAVKAKGGVELDTDSDTGDNFMTMLLKPSYTTQESEKVEDPQEEIKNLVHSASIKR